MDNIQSEIVAALSKRSADFHILTRSDAESWAERVRNKFCDPKKRSIPVWEALTHGDSIYDEKLNELPKRLKLIIPDSIVFIIDDWHGYSGIDVKGSQALSDVLTEMYDFVWFATERNLESLLCRNDHGYLISVGFSGAWSK